MDQKSNFAIGIDSKTIGVTGIPFKRAAEPHHTARPNTVVDGTMPPSQMSHEARGHTCHNQCGSSSSGNSACQNFADNEDDRFDSKSLLCGDVSIFLTLCNGMAHCLGVVEIDGKSMGVFVTGFATANDPAVPGHTHYNKRHGGACQEAADFSSDFGAHYVTNAFKTGVDFVVGVDEDLQVELDAQAGVAKMHPDDPLRSRVMLIPCSGTCGKSAAAVGPPNAPTSKSHSAWAENRPINNHTDDAAARRLIAYDVNHDTQLQFPAMQFSAGGKYKLCACDAALMDSLTTSRAHACSDLADYNILVGEVHVSGISCLLGKYNNGQCSQITTDAGGNAGLKCQKEN